LLHFSHSGQEDLMAHTPDRLPGTHSRENRSLLATVEKRALVWIARRLPAAVNSDHLSALGLGAMLGAGLSLAALRISPWAAAGVVVFLALNWFGDSLDGTVARVRNQQRPRYGFYVDHVIDLAGTSALLAGLASSGLMSPLLAVLSLAAFLLVSAEIYLATHVVGTFRMSRAGVGPTELRIMLAAGVVAAVRDPWVSVGAFGSVRLFDLGAAIAVFGMAAAFAASAVRNAHALYRAEPIPARNVGSASALARPAETGVPGSA
jgi:phosphatidylglycerophosphate synthase